MNILLRTRILNGKSFFIGILFLFLSGTVMTSCTNDELTQEELDGTDTFAVDKPRLRRPGDNN